MIIAPLDARARELAARHGWSRTQTKRVRLGLRVVLGLQGPLRGPVKATSVLALTEHGLQGQIAMVLELLADTGMLDDDRVPAVVAWFDRETADLPPGIVKVLGVWFDVQRHGSSKATRSRPSKESTTRIYARNLLPVVRGWVANGHETLREISKDDVLAALPAGGNERVIAAKALRSLFTIFKGRGLIFANPMAGIPTGSHERRQLPLAVEVLRAGLDADDPAQAALTALGAFHALRAGEIRGLKLTDVTTGHLKRTASRSRRTSPSPPCCLARLLQHEVAEVLQRPRVHQPPNRLPPRTGW